MCSLYCVSPFQHREAWLYPDAYRQLIGQAAKEYSQERGILSDSGRYMVNHQWHYLYGSLAQTPGVMGAMRLSAADPVRMLNTQPIYLAPSSPDNAACPWADYFNPPVLNLEHVQMWNPYLRPPYQIHPNQLCFLLRYQALMAYNIGFRTCQGVMAAKGLDWTVTSQDVAAVEAAEARAAAEAAEAAEADAEAAPAESAERDVAIENMETD